MKRFLAALLFLAAPFSFAQSTAISSTGIVDTDGFTWSYGSYSITFVPNPAYPSIGSYVWSGGNLQSYNPTTGALSNSGTFSQSLPSNTAITPAGSQWKIFICPNASAGCFSVVTAVTGSTQDLTALINAAAKGPRFAANPVAFGYGTVEVTPTPQPGSIFYNTTSFTCSQWTTTSWGSCGGGGGGGNPAAPTNSVQTNGGGVFAGSAAFTYTAGAGLDVGNFITAGGVNGVLNAGSCSLASPPSWCSGTDLGAWITAAGVECSWQCSVYVPAGTYTTADNVSIPMASFGGFQLFMAPAAIIDYTGAGYFIDTYETGANPSTILLRIQGGQITGTSSGLGGIRILPSNSVSIQGVHIASFSNGDCIFLQGALTTEVGPNNFCAANLNGVHLTGNSCLNVPPYTCGGGSVFYSANGNRIHNNIITGSIHWGIFEDATGAGYTADGNSYTQNDLEANGTAGSAYGAFYSEQSNKCVVRENYFEASPREVVLGNGADVAVGCTVADNRFTSSSSIPYEVELNAAAWANVSNNAEINTGANSTCFINDETSGSLGESYTIALNNRVFATNAWCNNGSSATFPLDVIAQDTAGNLFAPSLFLSGSGGDNGLLFDTTNSKLAIRPTAAGWEFIPNGGGSAIMTGDNSGNMQMVGNLSIVGAAPPSGTACLQIAATTGFISYISCAASSGTVVSSTPGPFYFNSAGGATATPSTTLTDTGTQLQATEDIQVSDSSGNGGGLKNATFGTAPTAGSGYCNQWADSGTDFFMFNCANGGPRVMPGVATAGTAGHIWNVASDTYGLVDSGIASANVLALGNRYQNCQSPGTIGTANATPYPLGNCGGTSGNFTTGLSNGNAGVLVPIATTLTGLYVVCTAAGNTTSSKVTLYTRPASSSTWTINNTLSVPYGSAQTAGNLYSTIANVSMAAGSEYMVAGYTGQATDTLANCSAIVTF